MKEMTALEYLKLKKELAERCSTFKGCITCDHRMEEECYELFFEYESELEIPEETLKMMKVYAKEREDENSVTIEMELP